MEYVGTLDKTKRVPVLERVSPVLLNNIRKVEWFIDLIILLIIYIHMFHTFLVSPLCEIGLCSLQIYYREDRE